MGLFDDYGGFGGLLGGAMGVGLGIPIHPSQLAAIQQQQAMNNPFEFQRQQGLAAMMQPIGQYGCLPNPTRCVKSKELTTRERSRRAINEAVEAVKKAQRTA